MTLPDWLKRLRHENESLTLRALAMALLFVILVVAAYLLIGDVAFHRAIAPLTGPRHLRTVLQPAKPPTVDEVAGWMTFEYLDRVFALPPEALKDALGITDPRYPRLSIRRWASAAGLDQALALERVKQAIRQAK